MEKRALIILSEGFEDIEAVTPIDILTRANVAVTIASLSPGPVAAAYGTILVPHTSLDQVRDLFDAIILPGGMRNAEKLAADHRVRELVERHYFDGQLVAAICASCALVLGEATGLLKG
ncbi:DJ-1 family protein, partial [candidate division GN15 bacterium]